MKFTIVTGSAGFIGFSLSIKLLERGDNVLGVDNHNDYYDTKIKDARVERLSKFQNYKHFKIDLSDQKSLNNIYYIHALLQLDGILLEQSLHHYF